ncbi:MAG: formyltransferase family protein [Patescibacteria group bacterium]
MTSTDTAPIQTGGIVFLTVPGDIKHHFAKRLAKNTDNSLRLMVIQKQEKKPLLRRLSILYKKAGLGIFKEIWFAFLLRKDKELSRTLEYFREHSSKQKDIHFEKTLEVSSVNSNEVYYQLKTIAPDLLVVWGGTVIQPRIIETAKHAINLHFGLCPYYLGAVANQHAVISNDFAKIGATIHHIEATADTGDVLATVNADLSKKPRYLFADLNDQAMDQFLEIATKMYCGKEIHATPQDNTQSKVFYLKDWLPSVRYKLAKKIQKWERGEYKI